MKMFSSSDVGKDSTKEKDEQIEKGESLAIITYGMGVHWALNAALQFPGQVEIVDLRTLYPLDTETMFAAARRHGKVLVVTEEQVNGSYAQSLAKAKSVQQQ